ncbi:hypothetical protein BB560_000952 [Smittium megazygosporum]|uniref:Origin recognition complex subunit 4 C-terminal domain-containing protein n=1 Tax=Smittium megazygosporum TaxID=133381 RepID=A0A2T9ZIZ4_9FUNG|nr:hypothetical protein BB560_000952 [Smittium megazygosporum]
MFHLFQVAKSDYGIDPIFAEKFNDHTKKCLFDPKVADTFNFMYNIAKDIPTVFKSMVLAVSYINEKSPYLEARHILAQKEVLLNDKKKEYLKELSLLEFYLLIAMKSLLSTGHLVFNFEMVYSEYKSIANRYMVSSSFSGGSIRMYSKQNALKAFEYLSQIELIIPCGSPGTTSSGSNGAVFVNDNIKAITSKKKTRNLVSDSGMKEFQMVRLVIDTFDITKISEERSDLPIAVKRWLCE